MSEIIPHLESALPAELVPTVEHLRWEFRRRHLIIGTQPVCFEILHSLDPVKLARWRSEDLREIESQIGAEAVAKFESLLERGTLPCVVAAFFDLYVESMNVLSVDTFHKLLAIASRQRINSLPVEWAKSQTEDWTESNRYIIRRWIKDVCDSREADLESYTGPEWPEWEAPRFLVMEPLGDLCSPVAQQEPFNSDTAQERLDAINTKFTLLYFEHRYTRKLGITLRLVAGEAAVYMAMHGVPPPASEIDLVKKRFFGEGAKKAVSTNVENAATWNPLPHTTSPAAAKVRSTSRAKTQAMYAAWQARYKVLSAANKDMTAVAIAKKIATEPMGKGKSFTTIRHKMMP